MKLQEIEVKAGQVWKNIHTDLLFTIESVYKNTFEYVRMIRQAHDLNGTWIKESISTQKLSEFQFSASMGYWILQ